MRRQWTLLHVHGGLSLSMVPGAFGAYRRDDEAEDLEDADDAHHGHAPVDGHLGEPSYDVRTDNGIGDRRAREG